MSDRSFVFLIVAIVVGHFLFAVGYLIWKIRTAPKSDDISSEDEGFEKDRMD
jgi:hypothetical protein